MTNTSTLGALGEELVARILQCQLSEDRFDSEKDMVDPAGQFVEVKTQNRYAKLDVFSIRLDKAPNLNKCMQVDRLVVVEYDHSDEIKIWECVNRNDFVDYDVATPGGFRRRMRGFRCAGMKLLTLHYNPALAAQMRGLSSSFEFRRK